MRLKGLLILLVIAFMAFGCQPQDGDAKKGDEAKAEKAEGAEKGDEAKPDEKKGDEAKADEKKGDEVKADDADKTAAVDEAKADDADKPADVPADAPTDAAAVAPVAALAAAAGNPFLNFVPADSPYAWVTMSVMPYEKIPFNMSEFGEMFSGAMESMAGQDMGGAEKFVIAIFEEFKDNVTREGIESLGLHPEGYMALYGVGAFPVMKMQLSSGVKFEAVVARVEGKVGVVAEKKTLGATTYRSWNIDGDVEIVAAIQGETLTLALAPTKAIDWLLPYAFGDKMPTASMATSDTFTKLQGLYGGGEASSVGYIDMAGMVKELTGGTKGMLAESLSAFGIPMPILAGDCATEANMLLGYAPRVAFGSYMANDSMVVRVVWEINGAFAQQLKGISSTVPGMGATMTTMPLAMFGAALDVKKTVDFATGNADAIMAAGFKCEALSFLGEMAGEIKGGAAQGVPPFVAGIKGFYVVLDTLDFAGGMPSNISATAVLKTDNPAGLWAAVAPMLGPVYGKVALNPGGGVVALPEIPEMPFGPMSAIMTDNTIGLSMGAAAATKLSEFVAAGSTDASPMILIGYDYARFFKLLLATVPAGSDDAKMFETMSKAYGQFGLNTMTFGVVDQGVEFRYEMAFNKK